MEVYLDFARHVVLTVLAILYLPVSILVSPAEGYEAKNPDEVKTSFSVVSDIHIEGNNYPTFEKYAKILNGVHAGKDNDTLVFLGDNTMNGQDIESIFFYTPLRLAKPAENLIIAPGNHDYGNGTGGYDELADRFLRYANFAGCDIDNTYYYKVIDGYYFIVLTTESDTVNGINISDTQLSWLNDVLNEATQEGKPAFVFSHHPMDYIEYGYGSYDRILNVLDDYENVFFFSGHTHWQLSSYSVRDYNGVTSINFPRATESYDDEYGSGVGAVVEVYDNEVLVRFRDFDDSRWVEGYEYSFEF